MSQVLTATVDDQKISINFSREKDVSKLRVNQMKQAILKIYENKIAKNDIGENDSEKDLKILSRALVAIAIGYFGDCIIDEAVQSIWDQSNDNGIDGAFFDAINNKVILVQSKWIQSGNGEPKAADISVFCSGVRDLIEGNSDHFAENIRSRAVDICEKLAKPGVTVQIVLVSTGRSEISTTGRRHIDKLLKELNSEDEELAEFSMLGGSNVFEIIANDSGRGGVNFEITLLDWSFVLTPYRAYFGIVDGYQLKDLWHRFDKRIVAKNIRHGLGSTEVNIQIQDTAEKEPQYFWYFNNGITLIAKKSKRAPAAASSKSSGVFELEKASIVNGAQTISSIARVDNAENLGKVRVPIRIILLEDALEEFGNRVTRANNLQNRIEGRDFVSQDREQSRIKLEMAIENISYEYARGFEVTRDKMSCDLIEATTALACSSGDPSHFIAVKTGVGRFFNDISRPPYRALFNPQTTGPRIFNAVRVLRQIDAWIEEKKIGATRKSGYSWGILVHGNRALAALVFKKIGENYLSCPIADFPNDYREYVSKLCQEMYDSLLVFLEREYPNKFLAVAFKNVSIGRDIFKNIT